MKLLIIISLLISNAMLFADIKIGFFSAVHSGDIKTVQEYIEMGKSVYNFFRSALSRVESSTTTLGLSAAQGATMAGALPPGTGAANIATMNNQLSESKDSLTTTCDDAENKLNSVIKVLKIAMIDATGIGELIKTLEGIKNIIDNIRTAVNSIPTIPS